MAAKAAYNRSMGEAICARLDAVVLNSGVDPASMPQVPIYPKNLTRPWEPEEPPYKDKDEEKDNEVTETEDDDNQPFDYFEALGAMPSLKVGRVNHVGCLMFYLNNFLAIY